MAEPKCRLLVVDDSVVLRKLLAQSLKGAGYEVVTARDGNEALAILKDQSFDLIILDVLMPGLSGLDVLKDVRKSHSKLDLPVLMATSMSDSADVVRALELGANDYVTKPIDLPVTLARIHAQLGLKAQASTRGRPQNLRPDGSLDVGSVLENRYKLLAVLGEGAYAVVYRARQLSTGQPVAVKLLRAHRVARMERADVELARFKREMNLIGRLQHPHIVRLIDSGELHVRQESTDRLPQDADAPDTTGERTLPDVEPFVGQEAHETRVPYLVMEYLEGEPLAARLLHGVRLGLEEVLEVMLPVLAAVAAAHSRGVVHRDLKPQNIFLVAGTDPPFPKVLDFGVAKLVDDESGSLTSTSAVVGTPEYMSPEQARGVREVGAATDQYALGTILYECTTGKRPFQAGSVLEYIYRIAAGVFEPPRTHAPELPEAFETVLLRAMAPQPQSRFPSVEAFGRALLPFARRSTRHRWSWEFGAGSDAPPPVTDP